LTVERLRGPTEGIAKTNGFERPSTMATGNARAHCHHGELLQGVFDVHGKVRRGLVTLPCHLFWSDAFVALELEDCGIAVDPPWKLKARRAVELTLSKVGLGGVGAQLLTTSTIPVCRGFGSSTADVTAAILAVADAAAASLTPSEVAALAVRAETASDPLMFDRALLFAQRDGVVLEDLSVALVPLAVVGFATDDGDGVDTLRLPPASYGAWEAEAFRPLLGLLRRALTLRSPAALGQVASASARLNQRHLPVRRFEEFLAAVSAVEAVGLQVAHSGNIAGFLFDAADVELDAKVERAHVALKHLGVTTSWRFTAGSEASW
jgi:uncharacterized protein involved in propanediol utilization